MTDTPRFTIMSYNVCGIVNTICVDELTIFLASHKPSVIIIQEPQINHLPYYIKKGKKYPHKPTPVPQFMNYAALHFTHPSKPTGVIFYIHKSCTYKPLNHIPHCTPYRPDQTNTIAGFVWVSSSLLPQPIVIGGVYLHNECKEIDVKALASNIALASRPLAGSPALSPRIPIYILGNMNARHVSWDPHIIDAVSKCDKGKDTETMLSTNSTNIVSRNTQAHTHQ